MLRLRRPITAFTLIELLIVIAIISILAAILFPVFARAKMAAHRTADLTHIRQIGVAAVMYADQNDETFLSFPFIDPATPPARAGGLHWADRFMPFVKNKEVFSSKVNTDPIYHPPGYWLPGADSNATPESDFRVYRVTYTLNHMLTRGDRSPQYAGAVPITSVERQAEVAMVGPGQQAWNWSACSIPSDDPTRTDFVWAFSDSHEGWGYELFGMANERGGFAGGANFVFLDLHAKFARAIDKGTEPGDQFGYQGRDLFRGQFAGVTTRIGVGSDGICPADRGLASY